MRRTKSVLVAFCALGETREPAALANCTDASAASGQYLVRIGLMSDVPDNFVIRRIEHEMQRHRQLDHAEPRSEMSAYDRDRTDHFGTQLIGNRHHLPLGQSPQIRWDLDFVEKR